MNTWACIKITIHIHVHLDEARQHKLKLIMNNISHEKWLYHIMHKFQSFLNTSIPYTNTCTSWGATEIQKKLPWSWMSFKKEYIDHCTWPLQSSFSPPWLERLSHFRPIDHCFMFKAQGIRTCISLLTCI